MLHLQQYVRKEKAKMGYKKDMGQYEYLEGWERCSLGAQLENGQINIRKKLLWQTAKKRFLIKS